MISKEEILAKFEVFHVNTGGIGSWLWGDPDEAIFDRLGQLDALPLSFVQFNQILSLGRLAQISHGFFEFYWFTVPKHHPYDVTKLPGFQEDWIKQELVVSLDHLIWGFYRLFVDALLWYGNVRTAFEETRDRHLMDLQYSYERHRFETEDMKKRGPSLGLNTIARDNRYLISEMACKSYGVDPRSGDLKAALLNAYKQHEAHGGGEITIKELLSTPYTEPGLQNAYQLSLDDALEEHIKSKEQLERTYEFAAELFQQSREAALENTKLFLSMVSDMDVYVATSMRTRVDFREMGRICDEVFSSDKLQPLCLRYFNPTLSAANGHEDKGLIECLMVKCAKVLVYCAGETESFGKDAEAAMALSLGKPVIFYCSEAAKQEFYQNIHPLSRLIEFSTGVAVGAIVTTSLDEVSELLYRIIENKMEYWLEQPRPGYLRLIETLTGSAIRIQTNDTFLTEIFWNHYRPK